MLINFFFRNLYTNLFIRTIRIENPNIYNLLLFICLFPSGLSFQDLEELSDQRRIPQDWKEILLDFLKNNSLSNQYQYQLKQIEEKFEIQLDEGEVSICREKKVRKLERGDFKPNNYIWLSITMDPIDKEIWFFGKELIIKYVEKTFKQDICDQNLIKLEYLTILGNGLIDRIKANYDYIEKLLESSAVSNYGLWRAPEGKYFNIFKKENRLKYLENPIYDFDKLKRLFGSHESNFFSCLESKVLEYVDKKEQEKGQQFLEIMEILCLVIPTLFKLMSLKESGAIEVAIKAKQVIQHLGEENTRTLMIKIKLDLFLVALYLGSKSVMKENFSLSKMQFQEIQTDEEKIKGSYNRGLVSAEIAFTRAIYYYKKFKHNSLRDKQPTDRTTAFQEIRRILKDAKTLLEPILQINDTYKISKAKVTMLEYKTREHKKIFSKQLLEDMEESLRDMENYGSLRLQMKANYRYASLKLE